MDLKYGKEHININLELADNITIQEMKSVKRISDIKTALEKSVEKPIGGEPFSNFINNLDTLLIIVPDITRYSGVDKILPHLLDKLEEMGVNLEKSEILFANGIHRQMTDDEIKQILTESIYKRIKSSNHNAYDNISLEYIEKTSFGTPIFLNKKIFNYSKVLAISSVNFHYFAGFSGGRKCIIPGISGKESCFANHKMVLLDNSKIKPGNMNKNPISQDMEEIINIIKKRVKIFGINSIIDDSLNITKILSGDIIESHKKASSYYLEKYSFAVEELYDSVIVSAGGFPKDINLIQAHKAAEHASKALKDGGNLILVAECRDGFGHNDFFNWFNFKTKEEFGQELAQNYNIYGQTAYSLFKKTKRFKFFLYSKLKKEDVKNMGLHPVNDINNLIEEIILPSQKILVMKNGGTMLPII